MENQQEPQGAGQLTEPQATEPTAEPNKQEPHGEPAQAQQIDWKAEARKWEKRAKESNAKLQGSSDLEDRLAAVEERAQKAEKEAADLKHKSDMLEVAAEFDVPREHVHGESIEEMRENAKKLKEYVGNLPKHPVVEGSGKPAQTAAPVSIPRIF